MILRGKTNEEIEAYYNKLEEIAKPGGDDILFKICMILKHRYPNHPNINVADKGIDASATINYVIEPLRRVDRYINLFIFYHIPWPYIEKPDGCHPQLELDTIFQCLKALSIENCQLVLREIKCTYNQRQSVLNALESNNIDAFKRTVGDFENTEVLSDICWGMHLYNPDFEEKSYEEILDEVILEARSDGSYHEEGGVGYIDKDGLIPEERFIKVLEYIKAATIEHFERRLKIDSSDSYTVRERSIIQSIIDRPEGKVLNNRYEAWKSKLKKQEKENQSPDVTDQTSKDENGQELLPKQPSTKSNAGAPKKSWLSGWPEEQIRSKVQPIQSTVVGELEDFSFGDKSDTEKAAAVRAAGAAIVTYSAFSIGLTKEKMYNAPAERILEAPRSSVNGYLRRLYEWYDMLIELGKDYRNAKKVQSLSFRWEKEDGIRAVFILDNINELTRLINNTKFAFGKEFRIETGLIYIPKREKSDAVLGGAIEYDDTKRIRQDGSTIKDGQKLSDGSDN